MRVLASPIGIDRLWDLFDVMQAPAVLTGMTYATEIKGLGLILVLIFMFRGIRIMFSSR